MDATYAEELLDIGAVWRAEAPPPRERRGVARERRARRLALADELPRSRREETTSEFTCTRRDFQSVARLIGKSVC